MNELKIDKEFEKLIPQLGFEERNLLEKNIVKEGCRDPIVLWNEQILDGHNRYAICTKHGLGYKTVTVDVANRREAVNWIIDNQLGRRNITAHVRTYLLGCRYTNEKKIIPNPNGTNQFTEGVSPQNEDIATTAQKIAKQNQVGHATVERAEKFSNAIDQVAESSGESAMDILTKAKLTQEDVNKAATLASEIQKEIVRKVMDGELKSFKSALQPIVEEEKAQKLKEELEQHPDTDYCVCIPFYPAKSQIKVCPCGCGYGYCVQNDKWYIAEQIAEMEDEPKTNE